MLDASAHQVAEIVDGTLYTVGITAAALASRAALGDNGDDDGNERETDDDCRSLLL